MQQAAPSLIYMPVRKKAGRPSNVERNASRTIDIITGKSLFVIDHNTVSSGQLHRRSPCPPNCKDRACAPTNATVQDAVVAHGPHDPAVGFEGMEQAEFDYAGDVAVQERVWDGMHVLGQLCGAKYTAAVAGVTQSYLAQLQAAMLCQQQPPRPSYSSGNQLTFCFTDWDSDSACLDWKLAAFVTLRTLDCTDGPITVCWCTCTPEHNTVQKHLSGQTDVEYSRADILQFCVRPGDCAHTRVLWVRMSTNSVFVF